MSINIHLLGQSERIIWQIDQNNRQFTMLHLYTLRFHLVINTVKVNMEYIK